MPFRKIDAQLPIFQETKEKHKDFYKKFVSYADMLTKANGKASKKSGKASSYARYLMRFIILYEEHFEQDVSSLHTFHAVKQLERLTVLDGFQRYNKDENHFPSAAFGCYRSYVTHLHTLEDDIPEIDAKQHDTVYEQSINYDILIESPTKKPKKLQESAGSRYPRNKNEYSAAKARTHYTCEMDDNHTTFLVEGSLKPYIEGHHLIPMAAQDYFEYTIDFADNIVTLCPTCHRKIHYATADVKAEMLKTLFNQRAALYPKYGISVNTKLLESFYGII